MLFFSLAFPTILLTVLALVPALSEPSADMGGIRFIDHFAPSVVVLTLALVALQGVPNVLAAYREQGRAARLCCRRRWRRRSWAVSGSGRRSR
jgi:ABC-2 type transport system permease protein